MKCFTITRKAPTAPTMHTVVKDRLQAALTTSKPPVDDEAVLNALETLGGQATAEQLARETGNELDNEFLRMLSSLCHWRMLLRVDKMFHFGELAQ
jgi:hypothetical protein